MKSIKFIRDVFVKGEPFAVGDFGKFDTETAALLVGDGSAIYAEAPAKDEKPSKKQKDSE